MALSRRDVLSLVRKHPLIRPFNADNMGPCSYDLTIGDEYYCYTDGDGDTFVPRKLGPRGLVHIPPNRCAFLMTEELLDVPRDVMGMIALRFGLTKQGIMVSPQAPIDPGYQGKILVMLYNLSDETRTLHRGERFVTVSFHQMRTATDPYRGPNQGVTDLIDFFPPPRRRVKTSLSNAEEQLAFKARQLDDQMSRIRKERARVTTTILSAAAIILAAATLAATILAMMENLGAG